MKISTVMFDLDGTLLPMNMDHFTGGYFRLLAKKLRPYGYEPESLIDGIWKGTAAMVNNDGKESNEAAFWRKFTEIFGERALKDRELFEEFYRDDFAAARQFCGFNPEAAQCIGALKKAGFRLILATNPLFPETATLLRIGWAGLSPDDFELITTYENIGFCKPNPEYYREILRRRNILPGEALMVGNDAREDLAAAEAGIRCFLLTECLLHEEGADLSDVPKGGYPDLFRYIAGENGTSQIQGV